MPSSSRIVTRLALPGYTLLLALIIVGPVLAPGYLLLRDAVSTPESYLSDAALGLTEAAPRALPQDFLVAIGSAVLDGGVVVKVLLVAGLWLAGWGAARLVATALPDTGQGPQFVAATLAIWNPYVAERLLQGHWSLLVGYGCLPWVAATVLRLRGIGVPEPDTQPPLARWCALAFWIALAGLTPTGALLAITVAAVTLAAPGGEAAPKRRLVALVTAAVGLTTALPWLMATAMSDSLAGNAAGAIGTDAFAARAEPGLGTLGSLAGLAGMWNAQAVPGSRTTLFAVVGTVVLLAIVAFGLPAALRNPITRPLLILAAAAVVLPALAATGAGRAMLTGLSDAVPGLAILRDGQKWVALALPGYVLAAASCVVNVTKRVQRPRVVAGVACAAIVLALPDLAWGVWGRMTAVHYPPGWATVAAAINADPRTVAVLPADALRRFDWAGPAPVLDPLPRWVRADVLSSGDLHVAGRLVRGEGSSARSVQAFLLAGSEPSRLAQVGVGWVVVETSTGETDSAAKTLAQLERVYADADVALYRVPGAPQAVTHPHRVSAIAAHLAWLILLLGSAIGYVVQMTPLTRRPTATPSST